LLIIQSKISEQASAYARDGALTGGAPPLSGLMANRQFFHHGLKSYTKLAAFLFPIVAVVPISLFYASHPEEAVLTWTADHTVCVGGYLVNRIVSYILLFFMTLVLLVCARRFHQIKENFHIKEEIALLTLFACICLIWLVIAYVVPGLTDTQPSILFYLVIPMAQIWCCFLDVVRIARKEERLMRGSASSRRSSGVDSMMPESGRDTLLEILNNENTYAVFEKFMIQEFAMDNVCFIKAVDQYKSMWAHSPEKARGAGRSLYNEFCSSTANFPIRLSMYQHEELKDVFEARNFTENTFDAAREEIIALVCSDNLKRFLHSKEYAVASRASSNVAIAEVRSGAI